MAVVLVPHGFSDSERFGGTGKNIWSAIPPEGGSQICDLRSEIHQFRRLYYKSMTSLNISYNSSRLLLVAMMEAMNNRRAAEETQTRGGGARAAAVPEATTHPCTGCGSQEFNVVDGICLNPEKTEMLLCATNMLRFEKLQPARSTPKKSTSSTQSAEEIPEELCYFCVLAKLERELALKGELGDAKKTAVERLVEMEARNEFLQQHESASPAVVKLRDADRLTDEELTALTSFETEQVSPAVEASMKQRFGKVSAPFTSTPLESMASTAHQEQRIASQHLTLSKESQTKGWQRGPTVSVGNRCSDGCCLPCLEQVMPTTLKQRIRDMRLDENDRENMARPKDPKQSHKLFDEAQERAKTEHEIRAGLRKNGDSSTPHLDNNGLPTENNSRDGGLLGGALGKADAYVALSIEEAKNWSRLSIYRLATGMEKISEKVQDWERLQDEGKIPAGDAVPKELAEARWLQVRLSYKFPYCYGPPTVPDYVRHTEMVRRGDILPLSKFSDPCMGNHVTALLRYGIPALRAELLEQHHRASKQVGVLLFLFFFLHSSSG